MAVLDTGSEFNWPDTNTKFSGMASSGKFCNIAPAPQGIPRQVKQINPQILRDNSGQMRQVMKLVQVNDDSVRTCLHQNLVTV